MTDANILGVIPARGGSKRVPRKNVRDVGGKPLIAHTIEQVNSSESITKQIVSTEDDEIHDTAKEYGGNVPFDRPSELASDTTQNHEVVDHALDWFESNCKQFDIVCLFLVTNPFRIAADIDNAIKKLSGSDAKSVIGVTEFDTSPAHALEIDEHGQLTPFVDKKYFTDKTRSQEAPSLVHPNGAIYAAEIGAYYEASGFLTSATVGYKMPDRRSFDIDTPFDLKIARLIMESR